MNPRTVKFIIQPDGAVEMQTHDGTSQCQAVGRDMMKLLNKTFSMGQERDLTSDNAKDAKVVANAANRAG